MKPPDYPFDPYHPAVQVDPYPYYAALRAAAPVVHTVIDGRDVQVLSHDRHIRAALTDWRTYSSQGGLSPHPQDRHDMGVTIATDPRRLDDHTQLLRAVAPFFGPRAIERIRGPVRSWLHGLVGDLVAAGSFDTVHDLAQQIPTRIVADLVGLPADARHHYTDWASAATSGQGPNDAISPQTAEHLRATRARVQRLAVDHSLAVGGGAVFAADSDGPISQDDATSIVWSALIIAGLPSTLAALTWALAAAARHPHQWRRYRDQYHTGDDARLHWPDEVLRHEAVFPHGYRTTTIGAKIDGYRIPAGSRVLLLYGSANRDPARWPQPDSFRPGRNDAAQHLGLGTGPHHRLGQHLARLEIQEALDAFAAHGVSAFQIDDQAGWAPTPAVRGWSHLPATVKVDASAQQRLAASPAAPIHRRVTTAKGA